MTKNDYIPPIMAKRRVLILTFEGFALLDLSGPAAVFGVANTLSGESEYEVVVVSSTGGSVTSGSGVSVMTKPVRRIRVTERDTILTTGAEQRPLDKVLADDTVLEWLARGSKKSERYGSVCTGAFLLAAAGLLDGRRATTHWAGCQELANRHPAVSVEPDVIYIVEGKLWTSAGVTTGIDMALAMVEVDLGAHLKGQIAKRLIVPAHRPGNQTQYSSLLEAQNTTSDEFGDLVDWLQENLDKPIKVEDMARRMGMSERSFFRRFTHELGVSPARFLEDMRLDEAKQLLEAGVPVKRVAGAVGFRSESGFRTAFGSRFEISPSLHKRIHCTALRP